MIHSTRLAFLLALSSLAAAGPQAPDLFVSDMTSVSKFGSAGGITAYAFGNSVCNVGDQTAAWIGTTPQHPVLAQNLYRIEEGRLEQIGMGWARHAFCALNQAGCGTCQPTSCSTLGIDCRTENSSSISGSQSILGPRSEISAHDGVFPYPFGGGAVMGLLDRRVQVATDELDPSLHPGARYFAETVVIAADDAAGDNASNNASVREVNVGSLSSGGYNLSFTGTAQPGLSAPFVWADIDPDVLVETTAGTGDGRFHVASVARDLGGGEWRYEYAVYNLDSSRGAWSFGVPLPPGILVTDLSFHDVDSHSGEPYSTSDWNAVVTGTEVRWSTDPFSIDPLANALRWGTLYSFGFTADVGPATIGTELMLFEPGPEDSLAVDIRGPWASCLALPNSQYEPNNRCTNTNFLETGSYAELFVTTADRDFYDTIVSPGRSLRVVAEFPHSVGDIDLTIYEFGSCPNTPLGTSSSSGPNQDFEEIEVFNVSTSPITYVIEVHMNPTSPGICNNYDLTLGCCDGGPVGSRYCTSVVNSTGFAAAIYASGSPVLALNDLCLTAEPVPSGQFGVFITSPNPTQLPFGNGFRCVASPVTRLALASGGGGSTVVCHDLNLTGGGGAPSYMPGETWHFQYWYRDPAGGGAGFNLTDGISVLMQ